MFIHDLALLAKNGQRYVKDRLHGELMPSVGYDVLHHVLYHADCNQDAIAAALHMEKGNLTRVLIKLENAGLLTRTENAQNRREMKVRITPQGEALWTAFEAEVVVWMDRVLEGLPNERRAMFLNDVKLLAKRSGELLEEKMDIQ